MITPLPGCCPNHIPAKSKLQARSGSPHAVLSQEHPAPLASTNHHQLPKLPQHCDISPHWVQDAHTPVSNPQHGGSLCSGMKPEVWVITAA